MNIKNKIIQAKKRWLVCMMVLLCCGVGVVWALWNTTYSIDNTFDMKNANVTLVENFKPPGTWIPNDPVAKAISLKNEGKVPVYVRIMCVESIKDASNTLLPNTFTKTGETILQDVVIKKYITDFDKNWDTTNVNDNGGWMYYKKILEPNEEVKILESIQMSEGLPSAYKNMNYELSYVYEYLTKDADITNKDEWGDDIIAITENNGEVTWTHN